MTQEIKLKLEQAAETAWEQDQQTNPSPVNPHAYVYGFKAGAQTILENPNDWGLQQIPEYYCAEKDRIGYVCEESQCARCEFLIQQDAVATRNELLVESEKEIISLQSQLTKYREALEKIVNQFENFDPAPYRETVMYKIAKEALKWEVNND